MFTTAGRHTPSVRAELPHGTRDGGRDQRLREGLRGAPGTRTTFSSFSLVSWSTLTSFVLVLYYELSQRCPPSLTVLDERRRHELTDSVHDGGPAGGAREGGEPRGAD